MYYSNVIKKQFDKFLQLLKLCKHIEKQILFFSKLVIVLRQTYLN